MQRYSLHARELMLPCDELSCIVSLGPVPINSDSRLLCPSRSRTVLPQEFDLRHGRDEYPSDVSDTDCEDSSYITKKKPNLKTSALLSTEIIGSIYTETLFILVIMLLGTFRQRSAPSTTLSL